MGSVALVCWRDLSVWSELSTPKPSAAAPVARWRKLSNTMLASIEMICRKLEKPSRVATR